MRFASFYYPGFYDCPARRSAAGLFIDEWRLVRNAPSSVFVPTEPAVPLLGYTDCSKASVLETEARLAWLHGVDYFIFNFYFDGESTELEQPLEVFANMRTPVKFGLNICCRMPRRVLPFGPNDPIEPILNLTDREFTRLADLIAEKYLDNPCYATVGEALVLTFYHVGGFLSAYGISGLRRRIELLRAAAARKNKRLWLVGLFSALAAWRDLLPICVDLPFDAYSSYIALPDFSSTEPVQDFRKAASRWLSLWSECRHGAKPVHPCVGAGWNASARGALGYQPEFDGLCFPYHPVITDDSADAFEQYLRRAASLALFSRGSAAAQLLFLGPWNEWSEGAYLLPDAKRCDAKLRAVLRVKQMVSSLIK